MEIGLVVGSSLLGGNNGETKRESRGKHSGRVSLAKKVRME